jgi:plastocyanin
MRLARGHLTLGGLALVGVVVAAACFSEHSTTAPSTSGVCTLPLGPGVGGSTVVAIQQFLYQADQIRIKAGTSVTWVNCETDGSAHTSTSDQGVWQSPLLAPGETFTQTFNTPGVFPYHCDPHPFMTGSVTVE